MSAFDVNTALMLAVSALLVVGILGMVVYGREIYSLLSSRKWPTMRERESDPDDKDGDDDLHL